MYKMKNGDYKHNGRVISRQPYGDGKRWYIKSQHTATGIYYDAQHCAQFDTIAAAQEYIDTGPTLDD